MFKSYSDIFTLYFGTFYLRYMTLKPCTRVHKAFLYPIQPSMKVKQHNHKVHLKSAGFNAFYACVNDKSLSLIFPENVKM